MSMFYTKLLEFNKILDIIKSYAVLDETKEDILLIEPDTDKDAILKSLKEVEEARQLTIKLGRLDLSYFKFNEIINRIRLNAPLSINEFYEVLHLCDNVGRLQVYSKKLPSTEIDYSVLNESLSAVESLKLIRDSINRVLDNDGGVLDSASNLLYQTRKKIQMEESRLSSKINQLLDSLSSKLSDSIITIRNGRKVLPVKVECRNQVDGIVQGESASGQTIYIEPFQNIEIENKIQSLKEEEKREIDRILYTLSIEIASYYEQINTDYEIIKHIDFVYAKAYYAVDTDSVMPKFSKDINLINARHPLIERDKIVPNTIRLEEYKTMIITGPNTGGKTVVLKTLGLLSLMNQSGILIPVELDSTIPIFSGIYSDIGDEQSIEQSLSTFSSHMNRIVNILNEFENDSLILIDELGSGTDPKEGASLAISIIDYLKDFNVYNVVTTHYPELKNYAYLNDYVQNASVEFNVETLKPTYKLIIGFSGKSNAFLISERLGLKKEIINHAETISMGLKDSSSTLMETLEKEEEKARLEREKYEALNASLKEDIRRQKEEYDKEKRALKKEYEEINKERSVILERAQRQADHLLDEIDKLKDKLERERDLEDSEISSTKKKVDSLYESKLMPKTKSNHEIVVGDKVRIIEFNNVGDVISIKGDKYQVQMGQIRSFFTKDELEYEENREPVKQIIKSKKDFIARDVKTRLDIRGMRYEDAKEALDTFIDQATLDNIDHIDVIHGYGTLTLMNLVKKTAEFDNRIKSYRPGDEKEGGRGVTVLYLK